MVYFLKKNPELIIIPILILFPVIFIGILKMCINFVPGEMIGSIDGWLGFLGGYFGVLGAVGTVWWQLSEEKKKKKKEEVEEKKVLLQFIYNIIFDIYNKIDITKKIIFYNLNPVTKVRGNPSHFLLEEKKLDILLEKASFLKTLDLSSKIYNIHYNISTIEMVCKEYIVSLGELYYHFGKEMEDLKQEDFDYKYNIDNILFEIDKIKVYNIENKNLKIFTFYLEIFSLINSIAEKYINNSKYIISHQEYIKLKKYLEIGNNIGINIVNDNKRMNILNFTTTFGMTLIQFENILYENTSLDVIKKELKGILKYLEEKIINLEKAVEG